MKNDTRKAWEQLALWIADVFETNQILYHFDESSCLYLRGYEFDMDDLDITVMWGRIDDAHDTLAKEPRVAILAHSDLEFKARIENRIIHVMTYESDSGIGEDSDREQILVQGHPVWCKTADFYFKGITPSHPMYELAKQAVLVAKKT